MRKAEESLDNLKLCLALCDELGSARNAIDKLKSVDCRFLKKGSSEDHSDPYSYIGQKGSIIAPVDLEHPFLVRDYLTRTKADGGICSFSFLQGSRECLFSEAACWDKSPAPTLVAHGLLAFALHCYSTLKPEYGYIDEPSQNEPEFSTKETLQIRYVFWANIFGPNIVKNVKRNRLLDAPGWRKEELIDGGMLYVATQDYREWWLNDQKEITAYFSGVFGKTKAYRAKKKFD